MPASSVRDEEYVTVFHGPVTAEGKPLTSRTLFHHFSRVVEQVHVQNGYWRFQSEGDGRDDARAFCKGLQSAEEVILSEMLGMGSHDDIELRWISGKSDSYRIARRGTAKQHLRAILEERRILGLPDLGEQEVPVYPIDRERKLSQLRTGKHRKQQSTWEKTSAEPSANGKSNHLTSLELRLGSRSRTDALASPTILSTQSSPDRNRHMSLRLANTVSLSPALQPRVISSNVQARASQALRSSSHGTVPQPDTNMTDFQSAIEHHEIHSRRSGLDGKSLAKTPTRSVALISHSKPPPDRNDSASSDQTQTQPYDSSSSEEAQRQASTLYRSPNRRDMIQQDVSSIFMRPASDEEVKTDKTTRYGATSVSKTSVQEVRYLHPRCSVAGPYSRGTPPASGLVIKAQSSTMDTPAVGEEKQALGLHDIFDSDSDESTAIFMANEKEKKAVASQASTTAPELNTSDFSMIINDIHANHTSPSDLANSKENSQASDKGQETATSLIIDLTDGDSVTGYVAPCDPPILKKETPFGLSDILSSTLLLCMECDQLQSHQSDCHIGSVQFQPLVELNMLQLRSIADAVERNDPEPWREHQGPPRTPSPDPDRINDLAEIARDLGARDDPDLKDLPDSMLLLMWSLKNAPGAKVLRHGQDGENYEEHCSQEEMEEMETRMRRAA
ncbi:uncharacterized protein BDR25DRAFT_385563 [Lindgomyces ingoldianus]|uniref:Uncharacterized protein n=1 Tax=Lindgomyces ingoldianus TaxID=673940 RepID=A0ACB6R447_9PLEO|nr:uncharacterized protein BDR25DRAFT_385563 [Lindgomyces ingoldianus]KAF2474094.1 hypothetical protein BDR25DRAFT_385563 [Lindgomyces ingoldianus]